MINMEIRNVVVAGGGVLGSQIAFQVAFCGFPVTIWLREECSIAHTQPKLDKLKSTYLDTIHQMASSDGKTLDKWARGISGTEEFNKDQCLKKVEDAYNNIKINIDMPSALKDADLVIESLAEDMDVKSSFYKRASGLLKEDTIVVTSSSYLLPSKLAKFTGRSDKFLALHFANSIWKNNTAEVMGQKYTSEDSFNTIIKFASNINMIPLPVKKEKAGYLLNSMLIPFLFASLDLYVNGISDVKSIDIAWKMGTGAPEGPFEILDKVGLKTAYNIILMYTHIPSFLAPYNFKLMASTLKKYIDEGKLGFSSGEGFYKY